MRTYNIGINQINNVRGNPIEENVIIGSSIDRSIFVLDTRQAVHVKKVGALRYYLLDFHFSLIHLGLP